MNSASFFRRAPRSLRRDGNAGKPVCLESRFARERGLAGKRESLVRRGGKEASA